MIQTARIPGLSKLSGHPKGLVSLCAVELLGRFAFYMLLGVLVLYVSDTGPGGLGLSIDDASRIYGAYFALAFFTPVFGGALATRWLGLRRAILAGGILFAMGLVLIEMRERIFFYLGLALLCAGSGLSRPSVPILLGNLYTKNDEKCDAGFNVLFFFINAGAFTAFLTASAVRNRISWQWVFWSAAIAVVIALSVLVANWRRLEAGDFRDSQDQQPRGAIAVFGAKLLLVTAAAAGLGYAVSLKIWPIHAADIAVVFGMVPVIVFFATLPWRVSNDERPSVHALLMVFLVATTFFAVLHMHGSALTVWAKEKTDRQARWAPDIWTHDAEPSYFVNSSAQIPRSDQNGFLDASLRAPRKRIVYPEVYQSWNPFWAMIFTPLVIVFFRKRESSGAPVSTAKKMFYGLLLTTMSMLLMELAAWVYQLHQIRVSGLWLIGTYCVITLGEVCLTPMGQSMVMKLAPAPLAGVLMGGWFCAIAIGSAFSGLLGEVQNTRLLFLSLTIAVSVVAALFWKSLPRLNQMLS